MFVRQECNWKTLRVTGILAGIVNRLGIKREQLELVMSEKDLQYSLEGTAGVGADREEEGYC